MRKHFKKSTVIFLMLFIFVALSATAFAAGKWVKAWQDDTLKIKFNGVAQTFTDPDDGSRIVPLIYNSRTYLPVKAIATLAGLDANYDDSTHSVLLTDSENIANSPKPTKDSNSYNEGKTTKPVNTPSTGTMSSNAGTIGDPVKFGTLFSWAEESKSASFGFKSNVTMSVTNVKKLTSADITAMNFKPDTDSRIEYVLVSVDLKGKNVTPTTIADSYIYYNLTQPKIWGSVSSLEKYIIGGTEYGFDGSIDRNMSAKYPSDANKIKKGSSVAKIDYSGNIILPIIKGETNYLVMEKANSDLEYESRKIYFALN